MATSALDIPLGSALTEEQARTIYAQGEEAVVFALLTQAKILVEQQAAAAATSHQTPSTPSGTQPPCQKPVASTRGKKRPGRKAGHPGSRREAPARIDRREEHRGKTFRPGASSNGCGAIRTNCLRFRINPAFPSTTTWRNGPFAPP